MADPTTTSRNASPLLIHNYTGPYYHKSVSDKGLKDSNGNAAYRCLQNTAHGQWLLRYFSFKGVIVTLTFIATPDDLVQTGDLAQMRAPKGHGFCNPVILGGVYDVYVTIGESWESAVDAKVHVTERTTREIARTLFHESLHAWFLTEHPERGTGHQGENYEYDGGDGQVRYLEELYDPQFLKLLKEFDRQIKC